MKVLAREIREQLQGKIDPALLSFLEKLAEEQRAIYSQMQQCISLVDQCVDNTAKMIMVNDRFKSILEKSEATKVEMGKLVRAADPQFSEHGGGE